MREVRGNGVDHRIRDADPLVQSLKDAAEERPERSKRAVILRNDAVDRRDRHRGPAPQDGRLREQPPERVVHMHDVELPPGVEAVKDERDPRAEGDEALGPIHVKGDSATDVRDLEVSCRLVVVIDASRHMEEPRRHHGDLVTVPREFRSLSVDMLGNTAELRVVVVADDRDPHGDLAIMGGWRRDWVGWKSTGPNLTRISDGQVRDNPGIISQASRIQGSLALSLALSLERPPRQVRHYSAPAGASASSPATYHSSSGSKMS